MTNGKSNLPLFIYLWTILSFIIDLFAIANGEGIKNTYVTFIVIVEVTSCWVAYEMYVGKKWALIVLTLFYFFMSFNLELDGIHFRLSSGLNFSVSIINLLGINIPAIIFFFFLVGRWRWHVRTKWEE